MNLDGEYFHNTNHAQRVTTRAPTIGRALYPATSNCAIIPRYEGFAHTQIRPPVSVRTRMVD